MMSDKRKKTARINIRATPELVERLDTLAEQMKLSRSQIISDMMWKICLCPEDVFELCPTCSAAVFDKHTTCTDGINEIICHKGHSHFYDFKYGKWVR